MRFKAARAAHPARGPGHLEFDEVRIVVLDGAAGEGDGTAHWQPRPLSAAAHAALAGWTWSGGWRDAGAFGVAWLLGTRTPGESLRVEAGLHF